MTCVCVGGYVLISPCAHIYVSVPAHTSLGFGTPGSASNKQTQTRLKDQSDQTNHVNIYDLSSYLVIKLETTITRDIFVKQRMRNIYRKNT